MIKNLVFLATLAALVGAIIFTDLFHPAQAATPADPELCDPWKMAGGVMIYRCEDDATGVVCYANGFGFIYCVEG